MEYPDAAPDTYWTDHYQLRETMVPYFLSTDAVRQILAGGKSTAFIIAPKYAGGAGPRHPRIPGMEPFRQLSDCSFDGPDPLWDSARNRIKPECLQQLMEASGVAALAVVNLLRDEYHLGSHIAVWQPFFPLFFCASIKIVSVF